MRHSLSHTLSFSPFFGLPPLMNEESSEDESSTSSPLSSASPDVITTHSTAESPSDSVSSPSPLPTPLSLKPLTPETSHRRKRSRSVGLIPSQASSFSFSLPHHPDERSSPFMEILPPIRRPRTSSTVRPVPPKVTRGPSHSVTSPIRSKVHQSRSRSPSSSHSPSSPTSSSDSPPFPSSARSPSPSVSSSSSVVERDRSSYVSGGAGGRGGEEVPSLQTFTVHFDDGLKAVTKYIPTAPLSTILSKALKARKLSVRPFPVPHSLSLSCLFLFL